MSYLDNLKAEAVKKPQLITETENGAKAYGTTRDAIVDLFSVCGALRNSSRGERLDTLMEQAYAQDPLLTRKMTFYTRDIRGGLGERDTGREMLRFLAFKDPEKLRINLHLLPEYGRWDDLVYLLETPVQNAVVDIIRKQLHLDMEKDVNTGVSLLAKWLPSINATSRKTRTLANKLRKELGMDAETYRRTLSHLREKIGILESYMSQGRWDKIDFSKQPGRAVFKYIKAFYRRDETKERFEKYMDSLSEGKVKAKSEPLDLVKLALNIDRYKEVK